MKKLRTEEDVRLAVERKLGAVHDAIWALMVKKGRVDEVLSDMLPVAFKDLLDDIRELKSLPLAPPRQRKEPTPFRPPDPRWGLLAKLQAKEAVQYVVRLFRETYLSEEALAEVQDLWWFRRRYPAANGPLSREAAHIWMMRQKKKQQESEHRKLLGREFLSYDLNREGRESIGYARAAMISHAGPLYELKRLCKTLARYYHWQEVEAVDFVLTGELPLSVAGYHSVVEMLGNRQFIVLEIDAEVSPQDVLHWYSDVRRTIREPDTRSRPLSPKIAALVDFVLDQPEHTTWRVKMAAWNQVHPEWAYEREQLLARDYRRAVRAIGFSESFDLPR